MLKIESDVFSHRAALSTPILPKARVGGPSKVGTVGEGAPPLSYRRSWTKLSRPWNQYNKLLLIPSLPARISHVLYIYTKLLYINVC